MKALVKSKAEPGLWLEEVEVPKIGINDVLVRVHRTGICGTDLHIYRWDAWAEKSIPVPLVIGHEFVGEVVETGANVADFFPGDIVSGEGHVVCGHCRNCLAGRRHLCAHTAGVGVNRPCAFMEIYATFKTSLGCKKASTQAWKCPVNQPPSEKCSSKQLVTGAGVFQSNAESSQKPGNQILTYCGGADSNCLLASRAF